MRAKIIFESILTGLPPVCYFNGVKKMYQVKKQRVEELKYFYQVFDDFQ